MDAECFVVDLDGVMWLGERPVPGAADAINRLVAAGRRVVFVTNMSRLTVGEQQGRLARCGVEPPIEVVTSAVAAASLLAPGDRVMICGGPGIAEAVEARGAVVACYATDRASGGGADRVSGGGADGVSGGGADGVSGGGADGVSGGVPRGSGAAAVVGGADRAGGGVGTDGQAFDSGTASGGERRGSRAAIGGVGADRGGGEARGAVAGVDAVVVGLDPGFDYAACGRAMRAVRAGARLIGTNHDPTYITPAGLEAGGGAILAAVAAAAETEPELAGKPNAATVACVRDRLGDGPGVVIGDRADSDGLLAEALGYEFALVLSGVTTPADLPVHPTPALIAADIAAVADAALAATPANSAD